MLIDSTYSFSNSSNELNDKINLVRQKIQRLVTQKNYPCVGALRAVSKNEYRVGLYHDLGSGKSSLELKNDLLVFLEEQKKSNSPYLSFWAAFDDSATLSEDEFEMRLWSELSHVASLDDSDWDSSFSADPEDRKFCFSLGGSAFFVVGLHRNSSRSSRQFEYPSLVFNLYEQFEIITRMGQYESMVRANRAKGKIFEGDVNPMVEKYGEKWEAIQFSGKQNTEQWKCPFHRFLKSRDP